MQRTIESLERIIALGENLLTTFDIEGLLTQIVKHVKDLLEADGATLYLVDPIEKLMISQVILSDRVEEIVLKVGNDSIAGYTALNRRSLNIPDAYGDLSGYHPSLKFNREIDEKFHTHTKSILTHPLVLRDELIGVFQVVNKKGGIPFDDEDLRILRNFAVIAGIAILNARLVERVVEEQTNANDIIEHISEKVIIQNLEGEILSLNHRAAEDLPPGISAREAKGRKVVDLFPSLAGLSGEIRKVIDHNLDKTFSGGKMPYVILTAKNSRQMIEKIILIIKEPANHHLPGPPPATADDPA
ncbi:MAG: Adenylate cyclase [Candidatus Ozemobacter sibiricus]|jgi:GAF domain-containing protein|uniref:Adenylate cyclase n=1 Tax=Candidatus Ozemobacter sibiricus TaxID=2268124 RepID=A0A367ZIS3_9BACT|nr:MAG: Adenylate cyclase [Candidatus Ozemobacter sibiricus]